MLTFAHLTERKHLLCLRFFVSRQESHSQNDTNAVFCHTPLCLVEQRETTQLLIKMRKYAKISDEHLYVMTNKKTSQMF